MKTIISSGILALILLSCLGCSGNRQNDLSGTWYLYPNGAYTIVDWLEEIEIPASDSARMERFHYQQPHCSFNFPFNYFIINGNRGNWNPGSLFFEGWEFNIDTERNTITFDSVNCSANTFQYKLEQDTIYLFNTEVSNDQYIFRGIKTAEDDRHFLKEFLASNPLHKNINLSIPEKSQSNVPFFLPKPRDIILFSGVPDRFQHYSCFSRKKRPWIYTKNRTLILPEELPNFSSYAQIEHVRLLFFAEAEELDKLNKLLDEYEITQAHICITDSLKEDFQCYPSQYFFSTR